MDCKLLGEGGCGRTTSYVITVIFAVYTKGGALEFVLKVQPI